jgi:hypothetical protein
MTATTELAKTTPTTPLRKLKSNEARIVLAPPDADGANPTTAICLNGPTGLIRSVFARVELHESLGHTYRMSSKNPDTGNYEDRNIITAAGYDKLNQFAGVNRIKPQTLIDDNGDTRPNPYMVRDGVGIQIVVVRLIGIWRNPIGNLVCLDYTLHYDLRTYFTQDMMSKWMGYGKKASSKPWGTPFDLGKTPDDTFTNQKVVPMPSGFELAIDLSNREVMTIMAEHINRQRFAERNAQTICWRNILKSFFAAAKLDRSNCVSIVTWKQTDKDFDELRGAVEDANDGRVEFGGEMIDVEAHSDTATPDDVSEGLAGDVDEDMRQPDGDEDDTESSVAPAAHHERQTPTDPETAKYQDEFEKAMANIEDANAVYVELGRDGIDGNVDLWGVSDWKAAAGIANRRWAEQVKNKKASEANAAKQGDDGKLFDGQTGNDQAFRS